MKTLFVKDLEKNQVIAAEIFLITELKQAEDKNGRSYLDLVLADKTGTIKAKVWSDNLAKINRKIMSPGKLIAVGAKVEDFRGSLQLNILDAREVDEKKLEDYLESSEFDSEEMFSELRAKLYEVQNPKLRTVLLNILDDKEIGLKFKIWPAAKSVHHPFRSGLLQHVLEMYAIAEGIEKYYPELKKDLLWAGIFLHDIGKIIELSTNGISTDYSKQGILLGHVVLGVKIFEDFGGRDLPEDVHLAICHMILSHHGKLEYGSPVVPCTLEAVLLSNIDDMSAKARGAAHAIKNMPPSNSFSDYNKWLEGARLWRGPIKDLIEDAKAVEESEIEDDRVSLI